MIHDIRYLNKFDLNLQVEYKNLNELYKHLFLGNSYTLFSLVFKDFYFTH